MKKILTVSLLIFLTLNLQAQERQETLIREINLTGSDINTLWIDNISGNIQVKTQNTDNIYMEIKKSITAENDEDLKTGWQKLDPVFNQKNDTIEVYLSGFCECDCDKGESHYWHRCDNIKHPFEFQFDFIVKIPAHINLLLSTINDGNIKVTGVSGDLKAKNVNGGIFLDEVGGQTDVSTINGDVIVTYAKNPLSDSRYYTLNGDLTVYYQADLSADLTLKSFNGNFYTDFEISEYLPSKLIANKDKGKGTSWVIENKTSVRIGRGGIYLDMETFNGNIYVRKRKSEDQR